MLFSIRSISTAVAALTLLQFPAQAAREPLRLAASSKWVVNYADDSCRLGRQFGEGKEKTLLFIDRFAPEDTFKLTLAGRSMKLRQAPRRGITLQFGPKEAEQKGSFFIGSLGKDSSGRAQPALIMKGVIGFAENPDKKEGSAQRRVKLSKEAAKKQAAAITYLRIASPLRKHVMLETGPMDKPLAALNKCIDELMTHWGIDLEKHASLLKPVKPANKIGSWMNSEDYPAKMLSKGAQGIVNFRLSVDDKGTPSACHIQMSTRPKEFDDAVCKAIMKRAKFTPAVGADGKAIASYFRSSAAFQMGRR